MGARGFMVVTEGMEVGGKRLSIFCEFEFFRGSEFRDLGSQAEIPPP